MRMSLVLQVFGHKPKYNILTLTQVNLFPLSSLFYHGLLNTLGIFGSPWALGNGDGHFFLLVSNMD